MKPLHIVLCALALCLLVAAPGRVSAIDFYFVGPSGGDFFDSGNWNDQPTGLGAFLATPVVDAGTSLIEHSLVIDGDTVGAATEVRFGMGSLLMDAGALLNVTGTTSGTLAFTFGPGGSFTMNNSALNVQNGASGQISLGSGSTSSFVGATVTASDDIFFRGATSIVGSAFESTGDDIELQDSATFSAITGSSFFASSTGPGGDFDQFIIFQAPTIDITGSSFRGGLLGIDGTTTTTVVATDSTFDFAGDVENAFASSSTGTHLLTLAGTSTLVADQIEEGVALFLKDTTTATFIDDTVDSDLDGWITSGALVRLDSPQARLVLQSAQNVSNASRVFNGVTSTTYAATPQFFVPSGWNGSDAVTLSIVPEPSCLLLVVGFIGAVACCRRVGG
ncbi:hypothetical protein Pla175_26100 [Pirellulimonas nuda]|uniref:PEP-CTERM protein-sorting domain-containing protein n=1 Tax=Pirellulimonas nuda TaxID=2528009 RepID=A0A518DCN7_9BACT|nr:hypothetical protein [Pirellulimonas nuda]QDU89223.1 hypothetical protein Pla175_26100 [Pirellulimonas nuda]